MMARTLGCPKNEAPGRPGPLRVPETRPRALPLAPEGAQEAPPIRCQATLGCPKTSALGRRGTLGCPTQPAQPLPEHLGVVGSGWGSWYARLMATSKASRKPKRTPAPQPIVEPLSPHPAEAAFNALRERLDALPVSEVTQPNFNLQEGAVVALAADALLREPGARAKVEALGNAGLADTGLLDGLATVARAAWFVRHKLSLAEGTHSDASLPQKLVAEVTEVRKRMLKTLSYQLEDDADAQRMLAAIREGSGYLDAANDLLALAKMYDDYEEQIKNDSKNYVATDAETARGLTDKVIATLGGPTTPESQRWRNYQARAFTLLHKHHTEAVRVGRFLLYYADGEALFPTIFAAVRSPGRRQQSQPAAPAPVPRAPQAAEPKPA